MRRLAFAVALTFGGLALSACGNASATSYIPSTNCTVSSTNTDYAGCNLAGRDLHGLDFQSDNLMRTNLSHANLDGANLQGATTTGAVAKGAVTNASTVCANGVDGPCADSGLRGTGRADHGV